MGGIPLAVVRSGDPRRTVAVGVASDGPPAANNVDALIDYGARHRSKLPISTSRAEGCVDEIANARMAKKQRMRWSPRGAHCVAIVRAAVLDGRFKTATDLPLAA